jgi:hypothetical protein
MSADISPGQTVPGMRWRGWPVAVVAVTVAVTFVQLTGNRSHGLPSLGYEQYDGCLCRLGSSPAVSLTSADGCGRSPSTCRVSRIPARPEASRSQIQALTCGF